MTCFAAKGPRFIANDAIVGQTSAVYDFAAALNLNAESLGRLYQSYLNLDPDKEGQANLSYMLAQLELEASPVLMSLFEIFDVNSTDMLVGFDKWMLAMWNILAMSQKGKPYRDTDIDIDIDIDI